MLPADASEGDRVLWAGLAAIVGAVHDGPEVGTDQRLLQRLEAACRSFGVPADAFDGLARRMGFHYYRPWDCYLSPEGLVEAELSERPTVH